MLTGKHEQTYLLAKKNEWIWKLYFATQNGRKL